MPPQNNDFLGAVPSLDRTYLIHCTFEPQTGAGNLRGCVCLVVVCSGSRMASGHLDRASVVSRPTHKVGVVRGVMPALRHVTYTGYGPPDVHPLGAMLSRALMCARAWPHLCHGQRRGAGPRVGVWLAVCLGVILPREVVSSLSLSLSLSLCGVWWVVSWAMVVARLLSLC